MDTEIFRRNLEVLQENRKELARRLAGMEPSASARVEPTRTDLVTVRVTAESGKIVLLHSAYDPFSEADRFIDGVDTAGIQSFMILGFALGYHVEELAKRMHAKSHIYVIEPDVELFRFAMGVRDLTGLIADKRVHWVVGLTKHEMFNFLHPRITGLFLGMRFVSHPASVQAFPGRYEQTRQDLKEFMQLGERLISTTVILSTPSRENSLMNLSRYLFDAGINDLRDMFKGFPAIIASAGPSLAAEIDLLAELAGRAIIICVSTALKPLLKRGVVPDFVALVDYHALSARYFKDLEDYPPVHMIADPKADYHAVEAHHGPKSLFASPYLDIMMDKTGPDKTGLRLGATVAHVAFYLAEFIGADPIIFVGQDLGYPDGVTYTPGTAIHDLWALECNRFLTMEMKEWERILRFRQQLIKAEDVNGRQIYTDKQMYGYLQQFEKDFSSSSARIIDAGAGGVRKEHTEIMSLSDAVERFCTKPIPDELLQQAHRLKSGRLELDAGPRVIELLRERSDQAHRIEKFYRDSRKVLVRIRENIHDASRARQFQNQVDKLRKEVEKFGVMNRLVMELDHANEYAKRRRDQEISASGATGLELKRMQLERDIANVDGLIEIAAYLEDLLKKSIERVEDYLSREVAT